MENFDFNLFNLVAKANIASYYEHRDADHFFVIANMVEVCRKYGFTVEQVPQLIEMQNIVVMG